MDREDTKQHATSGDEPLHRTAQSSRLSRWYLRVPLKLLAFALVTLLVLFPYPRQLVRHLSHIGDLDGMIEPDAPELEAWEAELPVWHAARAKGKNGDKPVKPLTELRPTQVQRWVERFVYEKVKYGWDWDVWGSADYMPTVSEMFEQARNDPEQQMREDCDGRAVIAASLMRRLGYQSKVVTDLRHVWVTTPQGEWMGPGRKKTMVSTKRGNKLQVSNTLSNIPVSLSFGVAVFPFWREVIIAAAAILLIWHRRMPMAALIVGAVLVVQGLLFMRLGYMAPQRVSLSVSAWPSWIGLIHVACGLFVTWWFSLRARRLGM